jgi:hypothetical protein
MSLGDVPVTTDAECSVIAATMLTSGQVLEYVAHIRFSPMTGGVEQLITDVELTIDRELLPVGFLARLDADPKRERQLIDLLARDALRRHSVRGLAVVHLSQADIN